MAKKKKTVKNVKKPIPKRVKTAKKSQKKGAKSVTPAKRSKKKAAKRAKPPKATPASTENLTPGAAAPTFALPTDGGGSLDLAHFRDKKNVVLYFYPKDNTPGCTVQACTFEKDSLDYAAQDAVVVGVSADSADSHSRFRRKYSLNFPLVVDEGAKLASRYGVWVEKKNYGKTYMGIQRATFLIDKLGHIAAVWPKVKVEGHSQEVLEALRKLR